MYNCRIVKDQIAVQRILQKALIESQAKNPLYSMRAFASKVGLNVGTLSSVLSGKRRVSKKLAERISDALLLDPQERSELLSSFPEKRPYEKNLVSSPTAPKDADATYLELSAAQFKVISDWEHLAVLSLMKTTDFKSDVAWMASRLGITAKRASDVVDRLIKIGLVERLADKSLQRCFPRLRTSDDVVDASVKKSHLQTLDLARESLLKDPVQNRDFTTVTAAIDRSKLAQAKERIRKFQDDIAEFLSDGPQNEVYRISMQVFPLSQINETKENEYEKL